MAFRLTLLLSAALVLTAQAQTPTAPAGSPQQTTQPATASQPSEPDKRILGVIPNFATADSAAKVPAISSKEKFHLAVEDSFDWSSFVLVAFYAGIGQLDHQYPSWGLGPEGYAKRFGGAFADQAIGNFLTEAILPTMLHDDPRFFRLAQGRATHRIWYAVSRVLITRKDDGSDTFNVPEIAGNALSAGISNLYYPAADRTVSKTLDKFALQVGTDAAFNVLKEFWPDMRQSVLRKRNPTHSDTAEHP